MKNYRKIIKKELEFHAQIGHADQPGLTSELIVDKSENIFLLLVTGWHKSKYYHHTVFHIALNKNTVIIKEDNTDFMMADKLEALGIPVNDIICAYLEMPEVKDTQAIV